jgi:hypothetical protein
MNDGVMSVLGPVMSRLNSLSASGPLSPKEADASACPSDVGFVPGPDISRMARIVGLA